MSSLSSVSSFIDEVFLKINGECFFWQSIVHEGFAFERRDKKDRDRRAALKMP